MKNNRRFRTHRFTIVELLVVMIISSIIAIITGTMLYFFFAAWHQNWGSTEMQQDGIVALEFMSRKLRVASLNDIGIVNTETERKITIAGSSSQEFYLDGDQLIYDPDIDNEGDEVPIVRAGLIDFSFPEEQPDDRISFTLVLEGGGHRTEISSSFKPRN
jgi:hypothetical protein